MKRIYFFILFAFVSAMAIAQEGAGTTNVDVNLKTDSAAGGFPWLWVVGGIVFVLLLVALLSGGRGSDRIVEKKTIVRE
jgi:Ca2+-binding RTX toxin-like protein